MALKQTFALACIVLLVLNMVFFALGSISVLLFWLTIGIIALATWYLLPKLS